MTKQEKKEFIEQMTENVKNNLIKKLDKIPDKWDGHELRQLFADYVKEEVAYMEMSEERKKDYENERLIKNI